ncbi:MAG: hypothetical protein CRU72_13070 [Candidatus Accumulibacter phosphatis]|jgi:hypothetical protein|nr:hypothetical protein [Candidatus Accumulibacter phosphatis]
MLLERITFLRQTLRLATAIPLKAMERSSGQLTMKDELGLGDTIFNQFVRDDKRAREALIN